VAFVIGRLARPGCAEWLAGATSCPNRSVVGPSCEAKGNAPSADAGEEMALSVTSQIVGLDQFDASLIHVPRRDVSRGNQVAQPLRCIWINLVVIQFHDADFNFCDMASRPPNNSTSLLAFWEYFMPVSYHDVDTLARL
jgi:hypothetical protein